MKFSFTSKSVKDPYEDIETTLQQIQELFEMQLEKTRSLKVAKSNKISIQTVFEEEIEHSPLSLLEACQVTELSISEIA